MKAELFTQNNHRVRVKAMKIGYELWIHMNGETWVIDQRPSEAKNKFGKKSNKNETAADGGDVLAPMPGKILRLNVKAGQLVEKDEVVVVMEAMKMEYSLQAPCAGKVSEVFCKESQQVELGSALVSIVNTKKSTV